MGFKWCGCLWFAVLMSFRLWGGPFHYFHLRISQRSANILCCPLLGHETKNLCSVSARRFPGETAKYSMFVRMSPYIHTSYVHASLGRFLATLRTLMLLLVFYTSLLLLRPSSHSRDTDKDSWPWDWYLKSYGSPRLPSQPSLLSVCLSTCFAFELINKHPLLACHSATQPLTRLRTHTAHNFAKMPHTSTHSLSFSPSPSPSPQPSLQPSPTQLIDPHSHILS